MLRVCGVTFDHTINYVSNFQAYALQTVIQNVSVAGEKCSYQIVPLLALKEYPKPDSFIKRMGSFSTSLIAPLFKEMRQKMNYFPIKHMSELSDLNNATDAFVCGSDVIWNPDFNYNVGAYYLDFSSKYAFSYAASFGLSNFKKEYLDSLEKRLEKLKQISVREKSGISIVQLHTTRKASIVLDPVLLMTGREWKQLIDDTQIKQEYIFVYLTHITPTISAFIDYLQKQTGCKVIRTVWTPKQALKCHVLPH